MKSFKTVFKAILGAFLYSLFALQAAYGEDTEIFFAPESAIDTIIPNVVFVIDTSGSMTSKPSGSTQTRIQIVKEVMDEVLTDINNVNVGLMRYNKGDTTGVDSAEGGPILFPATFIDKPADPLFIKIVDDGSNDANEKIDTGVVTLNSSVLPIGDNANGYVAVRFDNVLLPQGANIQSASIVFTAKGASTGSSVLAISGQLINDAPVLATDVKNLSNRDLTATLPVSWTPADWSAGQNYTTSDISPIVQEVVSQSGFCGANSLVFLIKGTGLRNAYSLEGSVADSDENNYYPAPKLYVKYANNLLPAANGCIGLEATAQIQNNKHDWERNSGGSYNNSSGDLDFYRGNESNANTAVGVGFTGVNVPKDAIIKSAYLTFTAYDNESGSGGTNIYGVDSSNADLTNYSNQYSNADFGPVNWSLGNWSTNTPEQSPDISSIVQSIVNQGGWILGNNMAFVLKGTSGNHQARTYDNSASRSAKLNITYQGVYEPGVITKRQEMKSAVASLPADSYTPISDVMAEAGLYFRGGPVTYGIDRDNVASNRTSHRDSWEATGTLVTPPGCTEDNYSASACKGEYISGSPNYISPITDSCQTSHIVFLTDGYPTSHHSETNAAYNSWSGSACSSSNYGSDCAVKIAGFLNNNDQNSLLTGKQSVTTHTIGFDIDFKLLEDMAEAGGGGYYTANNKDQLVGAITNIVASIVNVNTSFVSSGVSVNQYNRLTHNEELYYSLFSPASGNVWPGNIKRFKLSGGQILDANGNQAVDPTSAQFTDSAWSWWGSSADGNDVKKGGVAEKLGISRKVYSNISGTNLTLSANLVKKSNSLLTQSMVNATDSSDRDLILDWAQGIDVSALPDIKAHNIIGDPLHSQPTLVIYNNGSVGSPVFDTKVYVGTNHGFLHSFNSLDGTENWSFIPQELLPMLTDLQKRSNVPHAYGLDGSVALYIGDVNNNGAIDVAEGEKAYLYIGMRRGGSSYYALDISDPDKPVFKFKIDPTTTNFSQLGQTWSTPVVAKMNIGGQTNRLVMIFGGGYDDLQDTAGTAPLTDTKGNRIYIADALTGSHIWNSSQATQATSPAGLISAMNAVPSTVTAFDLDDDGLIDNIYASDTKAQIFRFDVNNSAQTIKGGMIANLQSAADIANNRRFYYQPDTALIRMVDDSFVSVSIGSGYRAHPLDENVQDYFYMIKDKGVLVGDFDMNASMSDLTNITSLIGDGDANGISDAAEAINAANAKGWYLELSSQGEKVIERSISFNNAVIFTSYIPPGNSSNVCEAASGGSRIYALKITDGNPYVDTNYDGTLSETDRYAELAIPGIAPPPQVFLDGGPDGVKARLCVGTQCGLDDFLPPIPKGIMGIRWRNND